MSRSAVIRLVVAVVAAMSAAAALLACNLQAASGRAVNPATLMNLQQSHHFKLPAAAIITAAVVLAAPINVLNEVSGHASAGADVTKRCATFEECEREIAQLRAEIKSLGAENKNLSAENKDFAAEIKSLGAENKALKHNIAFGHGVNASAADITGAITPANNTKGRRLQVSVSRHTPNTKRTTHTQHKTSLTDNLCGPCTTHSRTLTSNLISFSHMMLPTSAQTVSIVVSRLPSSLCPPLAHTHATSSLSHITHPLTSAVREYARVSPAVVALPAPRALSRHVISLARYSSVDERSP